MKGETPMNDTPEDVPDIHLEKASNATPTPPVTAEIPPPTTAVPATARAVTAPPRSGWVTAVGICEFVVAGLGIPVGVLLLVLTSAPQYPAIMTPFGMMGGGGLVVTVLRVVAVIEFVCAGALILAGVGVLLRKPWGRILTLVLAVVMLVNGLGQLTTPGVVTVLGTFLNLGFAIFALIVLLRSRYAAEFTWTGTAPPRERTEQAVPAPSPRAPARAFGWRLLLLLLVTHVACVLVGLFAQAALLDLQQRVRSEPQRAEPQLFMQQVQLTIGGDKPFQVYYATPYVSQPNLTIEGVWQAADHSRFFIKEQEATGFVIVPTTTPGSSVSVRWTAKGRLAR
jgi:hypothetical protein